MKREISFALLAHPTVQLVRFAGKAALAWFLVVEDFGEADFAGVLVNLALIGAILGLDEAVIYSRELGADLWRRLRRLHQLTGLIGTLLVAVAGQVLGRVLDFPQLPALSLALAPTVWVANLGVLPTSLLVRHRRWRAVFMVDLWSVMALTGLWVGLAAAGWGAWALVAGWWGNAVVYVLLANVLARELHPDGSGSDAVSETVSYGAHMAGANLTAFAGDRLDVFVVATLGRFAYGLYGWAQYVSLFMANYATSLSERMLFPVLADQQRAASLARPARECLRVCITLFVPAHVLLAAVAEPLVTQLMKPDWHDAGVLLMLLLVAAGARCVDVVGVTILKAAGQSRCVLGLGFARMALLVIGVLALFPSGAAGVALGVLLARVATALLVLVFVLRRVEPPESDVRRAFAQGLRATVLWCVAFGALAWQLRDAPPGTSVLVDVLAAVILWFVVRVLADRSNLARDLSALRGWWKEARA